GKPSPPFSSCAKLSKGTTALIRRWTKTPCSMSFASGRSSWNYMQRPFSARKSFWPTEGKWIPVTQQNSRAIRIHRRSGGSLHFLLRSRAYLCVRRASRGLKNFPCARGGNHENQMTPLRLDFSPWSVLAVRDSSHTV